MAAANEGYVINKTNDRKFLIRCMAPVTNSKNQPALAIPLVNVSSASNILFRFVGQTETISFSFAIFDDDVDVADETHGSTVKTVNEQIAYLKEYIYTEKFNTYWTLQQDRFASGAGVSGVIEDLTFENKAGSVKVVVARLTFKLGRIGEL